MPYGGCAYGVLLRGLASRRTLYGGIISFPTLRWHLPIYAVQRHYLATVAAYHYIPADAAARASLTAARATPPLCANAQASPSGIIIASRATLSGMAQTLKQGSALLAALAPHLQDAWA